MIGWRRPLIAMGTLCLLTGIMMTVAFRTLVLTRLAEIDTRITRLQSRLDPVRPLDVLCGISDQLRVLGHLMAGHCDTVHGVPIELPPLPWQCHEVSLGTTVVPPLTPAR